VAAMSSALETADPRSVGNPCLAALWPAMQRLDSLLDGAVRAMQPARGADSAALFRGLYIEHKQVTRLLSQSPGATPFGAARTILDLKRNTLPNGTQLARLVEEFHLSSFDADILLIALAPELDLRYERIYAYLQDDITRKRPTVELTLNLLCDNADAKLDRRVHFSAHAPLLLHSLLHLVPDANQAESSLLAHSLKLDDRICRLLLGQDGLDKRLTSFCRLIDPATQWDQLRLGGEIKHALSQLEIGRASCRERVCLGV